MGLRRVGRHSCGAYNGPRAVAWCRVKYVPTAKNIVHLICDRTLEVSAKYRKYGGAWAAKPTRRAKNHEAQGGSRTPALPARSVCAPPAQQPETPPRAPEPPRARAAWRITVLGLDRYRLEVIIIMVYCSCQAQAQPRGPGLARADSDVLPRA